jgi:hypothetical protein
MEVLCFATGQKLSEFQIECILLREQARELRKHKCNLPYSNSIFFECTSIEARIMCVRQQPEYCEENLHCLHVLPVSAYYESEVNKCNCEAKAECESIDTSLGPQ